jgi:hypothetical protein
MYACIDSGGFDIWCDGITAGEMAVGTAQMANSRCSGIGNSDDIIDITVVVGSVYARRR